VFSHQFHPFYADCAITEGGSFRATCNYADVCNPFLHCTMNPIVLSWFLFFESFALEHPKTWFTEFEGTGDSYIEDEFLAFKYW